MQQTQPAIFISHGGPNIVLDDTPARDFLEGFAATIRKPDAIVIVSAHFETDGPVVVTDAAPEMIYDFGGFSPELYRMVYPAPGAPDLAMRVAHLLADAGLEPRIAPKRGYDHGAWTPLKLAFPAADIPVVQLSIDPSRDAQYHFRLGQAVAPLRQENVLIIGSGHITHNLRAVFSVMRSGAAADPELARRIDAFTGWIGEKLGSHDHDSLMRWNELAPFSRDNHPTDEHLMPLFFALGAGGVDAPAHLLHRSAQFGVLVFENWRFG